MYILNSLSDILMKKIIFIIAIFTCAYSGSNAQTMEELHSIYSKSKFQFVKPETLDQLMIALRKFEADPIRNQDTLLLETYKSISSAYMINNHFKQAYEVFNKYIRRKEEMLAADRTVLINKAVKSFTAKQLSDEKEEMELRTTLNQLKDDNESLTSKRQSFKRNFSLALIILTSVFAIMLVSAGIKAFSIRSKLEQSRNRMKNIHRQAVIGNFSTSLIPNFSAVLKASSIQIKELHQLLKKQDQSFSPIKEASQIITQVEKHYDEISKIP